MKYLILLLTVLTLVLAGCSSQTTLKYQCVDGTFVDSTDLCSSKTCPEANCPKSDCSACPVKTETKIQTQTITKNIYICPDGTTEVENKVECTAKFLSDANYKLGDEVIAGNFKWTFKNYNTASQIGEDVFGTFMGVKADGEFLIIDVEVENIGKNAQLLSDSYVKLIDDQEREFSTDTMAAIYLKPQGSSFSFDTVNPGIIKKGKIVFDVPSGLKVAKIKVLSDLYSDSFYNIKLFG